MPVKIDSLNISALVDCGSSINLLSQQLYDNIPESYKSKFSPLSETLTLANNQSISIYGTSNIKISAPQGKHWIKVYILKQTSHPLILGTKYLFSKKIIVDFGKHQIISKYFKVMCRDNVSIAPNTEMLITGKIEGNVSYGMQGICCPKQIEKNGLLVSKAVCTVNRDKEIPVKILNFTNNSISLKKGKIIAELELFSNDHIVVTMPDTKQTNHYVQNVQLADSDMENFVDSEFISNFNIPDHLSGDQKSTLIAFLNRHKSLFVTPENPELGYTEIVQHKITLKHDFKPKNQRSYRLTPDKKEVLRHHLDELLQQGVIAPVNETDDVPITSPIVLVSKRVRNNSKIEKKFERK